MILFLPFFKNLRTTLLLIPAAVVLMVACTRNSNTGPSETETSLTSPVATLTEIATIVPSPTMTATREPTLTAIPTLAQEEAQLRILELLETNGGCRLPCFWGIVPGETTWQEAYNFLDSFSTQIISTTRSERWVPRSEAFGFLYTVPTTISLRQDMHLEYRASKGVVDFIRADATIDVSELLSNYGEPGEVWIRALNYGFSSQLEFFVGIYYPEKHILAVFYDHRADILPSGYLFGCVDEKSKLENSPELWLWTPQRPITWEEVDPFLFWDSQPTLEDATGMTIEAFYEMYKNPEIRPCIQTPAAIWEDLPDD